MNKILTEFLKKKKVFNIAFKIELFWLWRSLSDDENHLDKKINFRNFDESSDEFAGALRVEVIGDDLWSIEHCFWVWSDEKDEMALIVDC